MWVGSSCTMCLLVYVSQGSSRSLLIFTTSDPTSHLRTKGFTQACLYSLISLLCGLRLMCSGSPHCLPSLHSVHSGKLYFRGAWLPLSTSSALPFPSLKEKMRCYWQLSGINGCRFHAECLEIALWSWTGLNSDVGLCAYLGQVTVLHVVSQLTLQ